MSKCKASRGNAGFAIVENLVALALLGLIVSGSARLIFYVIQSNATARNFAALVSDTHGFLDSYRAEGVDALLDRFSPLHINIANGATVTAVTESSRSKTTFTTTFTAIKSASNSAPEAVRIRVDAQQRRGKWGSTQYEFETVVAQAM